MMDRSIIFAVLGLLLTAFSWRSVLNYRSHGFYRFISWLCTAWLLASNYKEWVRDPLSVHQLVSWSLLILSVYLVSAGAILMKKAGKPKAGRNEKALYPFEQTTELVDKGIFKYIRHPLYSSLLCLNWGIFFKNPTLELFVVASVASVFLYLTARFDEKECKKFFGDKYIKYMKRTRRFIPYIF